MGIRLSCTALMPISAWMAGRATLTDYIMNSPMNDVRVATNRAERSGAASSSWGMVYLAFWWAACWAMRAQLSLSVTVRLNTSRSAEESRWSRQK